MSFDDAVQALGDAIEADAAPEPLMTPTPTEQATPSPTPEGENAPQVQPHHSQNQPRERGKFAPTPVETPVEDTFDGGKFNPDTLPPELQDGWKQLQADYTRKMQEVAEQRKQFEGIDPAQAREAVELFTALQDPNYLVQFHGELTQALEAQGLTRAQASAEAARMTEEAAGTPTAPSAISDRLAALREDPELAPLADSFAALEQRNASLEERLDALDQERRVAQEQEAIRMRQMAFAAELQRQEMAIRQQNPHYTDETTVADGEISDMDAIYALAPNFDNNLLLAEEFYRKLNDVAVANYVRSKTAVDSTPGVQTFAGQGSTSEQPTELEDLDQAWKAADAHLKAAGLGTLDL